MKKAILAMGLSLYDFHQSIQDIERGILSPPEKKYNPINDPFEKICKSCGKVFYNRGKWCEDCFKEGKNK